MTDCYSTYDGYVRPASVECSDCGTPQVVTIAPGEPTPTPMPTGFAKVLNWIDKHPIETAAIVGSLYFLFIPIKKRRRK